jgi:hypothetical protein
MKWLHENITTVNIPRETIRNAYDFSLKIIDTIDYKDSNQTNLNKIQDDHFVSKIGEEAVKIVISAFGKVTGPDYTIYNGNAKSWDDDLFKDNIGIAVKTQRRTNALKYGLSWTFQSGDSRKDSILHKPDAWVIFVEYDDTDPKKNPYCCHVYPPFQIKELTFKQPKLSHLKTSKKVVYADTLVL